MVPITNRFAALAVVLCLFACAVNTDVSGRSPPEKYSPTLKGHFRLFPMPVPGYGQKVYGVEPDGLDSDSPLHQVRGLENGFIFELDGCKVDSFRELERHTGRTTVKWVERVDEKAKVRTSVIQLP